MQIVGSRTVVEDVKVEIDFVRVLSTRRDDWMKSMFPYENIDFLHLFENDMGWWKITDSGKKRLRDATEEERLIEEGFFVLRSYVEKEITNNKILHSLGENK